MTTLDERDAGKAERIAGALISRRTAFVLGRVGLTLEASAARSDAQLLKVRGLGPKALREIRRAAPPPAGREPSLEPAV